MLFILCCDYLFKKRLLNIYMCYNYYDWWRLRWRILEFYMNYFYILVFVCFFLGDILKVF